MSVSSPNPIRYFQFGKRVLDGFGWIAPVTNNRLGDALNIEFVHEHLFLVEGEKVLMNLGYGEKSQRFSEDDYGKKIETLEDLERNGYWLIGRPYHEEAGRVALEEQEDGHYYSFFSNQCQDWADRLRKRIERIEKDRSMPPLGTDSRSGADARFWKEKPPTAPGSLWLALISLALGIGSILAPQTTAANSMHVLAGFFIISGIADVIYAFHSHAWRQLLSTVFFALLNFLVGAALFYDSSYATRWAGGLFGIALAVNGGSRSIVALRSRPHQRWLGSLVYGAGLIITAILLLSHSVGQRDAIFGFIIGVNFILGGAATLWYHWNSWKSTSPK